MSEYTPFFSKIYDWVFFPLLHSLRNKVAEEVAISNPHKVIDMCCGTGNQIKYLKKIQNFNIVGIDISYNMLAVAHKNNLEKCCQKQDATNTNFENESFDIAILNFILHETKPENAEKISAEAKRIVKKSGKIIITDYVFDNKTNFIGKAGAYFVEFLIGGQHFNNFKTYIKNNLLNQYTSDLQLQSVQNLLFGAVRIHTFINKQNSK